MSRSVFQVSSVLDAVIARYSGAPIDITPLKDNPVLGNDPKSNSNFDFSIDKTQNRCPFAAHIEKTNPRSDLAYFGGTTIRRIWRQGIPFGRSHTGRTRESEDIAFSGFAF
jgi:deferrochelatase/peroxidase EfeB